MMATLIGMFDHFVNAQQVVNELFKRGFRQDEISLIANASSNEYASFFHSGTASTAPLAQEKPLTTCQGVVVGATGGAISGIVAALAPFVIPGIGPIIGAGPLIAGLTGGALGVLAGAATGGIAAGLLKAGVPQEEAHLFEESIKRGGTIIVVQSPETAVATVQKLMDDHCAVDVVRRQTEWRADSSTTNAWQTHQIGGMSFGTFDRDLRKHYATYYPNSEYTFAQLVPFYRYGYDLATDPRYASATWAEVETHIEPGWHGLNPESVWVNFRDAVHCGWEMLRGTC